MDDSLKVIENELENEKLRMISWRILGTPTQIENMGGSKSKSGFGGERSSVPELAVKCFGYI